MSSLLLSLLMNTARQPSQGCSVCLWASSKPAKGVTVVFRIIWFASLDFLLHCADISVDADIPVDGVKAVVAQTVAAWTGTSLLYSSLADTCGKMSQGQSCPC